LELSKKVGGSSGEPLAKKMMEFQESEKQRKRLEDQNLKLRLQLEEMRPRVEALDDTTESLKSILSRAKSEPSSSAFVVELQKLIDGLQIGSKSPKKVCFYCENSN